MTVDKKSIVIKFNGPIYPLGGIYGPITVPYMESVGNIYRMLSEGIPVYEVIGDKEVELTTFNFNQELDQDTLEPTTSKVVKSEKKNDPIKTAADVEVTTVPIKDEADREKDKKKK